MTTGQGPTKLEVGQTRRRRLTRTGVVVTIRGGGRVRVFYGIVAGVNKKMGGAGVNGADKKDDRIRTTCRTAGMARPGPSIGKCGQVYFLHCRIGVDHHRWRRKDQRACLRQHIVEVVVVARHIQHYRWDDCTPIVRED